MMRTARTHLILAAMGVLFTLATGAFKIQLIESLDARHYGIPLDWRVENDWCGCTQFSWGNFAFDAFFYLITAYGMVLAYSLAMSSGRRAS